MKILVKIILVGLIALISNEAFAVIKARSGIKAIFSSILNSKSLEIKLNDMLKGNINSFLLVEDPNQINLLIDFRSTV